MVLEKQPAKIVFCNNFDYQAHPDIKDKHKDAYEFGIEEFANALVYSPQPDNATVVFLYDSTRNYNISKNPYDTLAMKNEINSLCEKNNADFLLSLDRLNFYYDWEVIREEDSDGNVSKTKEFFLYGNYYLTLYNVNGSVRKSNYLERSCFYSSRPTLGALITIKPNLNNAKKQIQKLSNEAGKEYLAVFYPTLEDHILKLYTGKVFKETNRLIKYKQFNEAIILLQDLTNDPKHKIAAKARHNLSIAKELKLNNTNVF